MLEDIDKEALARTVEYGVRFSIEENDANDVILKLRKSKEAIAETLPKMVVVEFICIGGTFLMNMNAPTPAELDIDVDDFDNPEFIAELDETLLHQLQQPYELPEEDVAWDFVSADVLKEVIDQIHNVDIPNNKPSTNPTTGRTVVFEKILQDLET